MDLNAIIVAMIGSKIARVQCRTCKKERAYSAPKGATDPMVAPPKAAARERASGTTRSTRTSVEDEWKKKMEEAGSQAKRVVYSIKAALGMGDVVKHPSYGDGVVLKLIFPNKAEVIFQDDLRTLIHSKT